MATAGHRELMGQTEILQYGRRKRIHVLDDIVRKYLGHGFSWTQ